jgi:bifunctional DNA-binding transcriptional regulator/antitoxin component of YhaV-PrlF toxin-antitoxin module
MASLTVTAKGQVTLRKELLDHLGVKPGEKIAFDLLPDGKASIQAEKKGKPIEHLFGFLKREGERPLSLEEIDEIIKDSWARRR